MTVIEFHRKIKKNHALVALILGIPIGLIIHILHPLVWISLFIIMPLGAYVFYRYEIKKPDGYSRHWVTNSLLWLNLSLSLIGYYNYNRETARLETVFLGGRTMAYNTMVSTGELSGRQTLYYNTVHGDDAKKNLIDVGYLFILMFFLFTHLVDEKYKSVFQLENGGPVNH